MNNVTTISAPSQAMNILDHTLNAYSKPNAQGREVVSQLRVSSALHELLPAAIQAIRESNDYRATAPEQLPALRGALEDALDRPHAHLESSVVQGMEFNALLKGFRDLLAHLPTQTIRKI